MYKRQVQNGDVRGIYHKSFLPNYSVFDEARYFSKGTQADTLFWYDDIAIGINICEDIWIENGPAEEQVKQGASLIININASPYDIQKNETRKEIVMKKALKLNVPIIYLNMVGGQDELVFDGGSFVVDDLGEIIYQASSFKEEVFHLDIDLKIKKQNDKPSLLIRPKTIELKDIKSKPSMSENESIYSALKLGLLDYVLSLIHI